MASAVRNCARPTAFRVGATSAPPAATRRNGLTSVPNVATLSQGRSCGKREERPGAAAGNARLAGAARVTGEDTGDRGEVAPAALREQSSRVGAVLARAHDDEAVLASHDHCVRLDMLRGRDELALLDSDCSPALLGDPEQAAAVSVPAFAQHRDVVAVVTSDAAERLVVTEPRPRLMAIYSHTQIVVTDTTSTRPSSSAHVPTGPACE